MVESDAPLLIIGNKNYSSWSLRAWLLLRAFDVNFRELQLPLDTHEFDARIGDYSPSGRVPALRDGAVRVWDSLAIAEYVNERWLAGRGWPVDAATRAHARAISAEMHAGFAALRQELPMNCRKRAHEPVLSADAVRDIARVKMIWRSARQHYGAAGSFLFGEFGIADAMYAPVVLRFISYGVALDALERSYVDAIATLPAMRAWLAEAATEPLLDTHERMTP
jgi:glutathione S-transferase